MTVVVHSLADLERAVTEGGVLTPADVGRVLACPDLLSVGMLGELARHRASGDTITFGRVSLVPDGPIDGLGDAGELRLAGTVTSIDDARRRVQAAVPFSAGRVLAGFSLADLVTCCGHDHLVLADAAAALKTDGLQAVAETPADLFVSTEDLVEVLRAVMHGGLTVPRFTIERASFAERLPLIERVVEAHSATGAGRAFAPLPRHDVNDAPSTGYDDVKTIAVARLRCPATLAIQVDWPLYGPKLAQVALAYGASDVDGIAAVDTLGLGHRRSPVEEIARQIRAAGGTPVERDGHYTPRR